MTQKTSSRFSSVSHASDISEDGHLCFLLGQDLLTDVLL
jgi:hypothetical protein